MIGDFKVESGDVHLITKPSSTLIFKHLGICCELLQISTKSAPNTPLIVQVSLRKVKSEIKSCHIKSSCLSSNRWYI